MKVNINNKQNTNNTNLITAFNPAEEKNENDIKENLKDYFDSIAEKIKVFLIPLH